MNQKGQGFEVFNLLIGAILALAILVIIISIVNYLEQIKIDSSIQSIEKKLSNAAQSPDGSVFVSEDVVIPKDYSFNSKRISELLNVEQECIEFDFPPGVTWAEYPSGEKNVIFFPKRIQTNFYVLCNPGNINFYKFQDILECNTNECEFCCLLSFGVDPTNSNN